VRDKIVYEDGDKTRVLVGKICGQDNDFVSIQLDVGVWQISRRKIISMRVVQDE
jgi:hypothetical protein